MGRAETDLHLYLDDSLSMDVVRTLAERTGYNLEGKDLKRLLCVGDDCASLAECLSCFNLPSIPLQTENTLELTFCGLVKHLVVQGLVCVEIRLAPQLHRQKGLTQEQAVGAVARGAQADGRESGVYAGALLYVMIDGSDGDNGETLELSRTYLGKGVADADIAGSEGLVSMEYFGEMFRRIHRAGVPFTIHTGECGDYENVVLTVFYGARRIGHGCAAIRSEVCTDLLKRENITLEVCIVSSLQTKAAESIEAHLLKEFYARGIRVIYNTDDMMMPGTDLEREAALITGRIGLIQKSLIRMNEMTVEVGFAGVKVREGILKRMREQSGIQKQKRDNLDECLDESLEEYWAW